MTHGHLAGRVRRRTLNGENSVLNSILEAEDAIELCEIFSFSDFPQTGDDEGIAHTPERYSTLLINDKVSNDVTEKATLLR